MTGMNKREIAEDTVELVRQNQPMEDQSLAEHKDVAPLAEMLYHFIH